MRPAQRSRLLGEVNDRIHELLESADPDLPGEFHCECGEDCAERVVLSSARFVELRRGGGLVLSANCLDAGLGRRGRRARRADGVPALG